MLIRLLLVYIPVISIALQASGYMISYLMVVKLGNKKSDLYNMANYMSMRKGTRNQHNGQLDDCSVAVHTQGHHAIRADTSHQCHYRKYFWLTHHVTAKTYTENDSESVRKLEDKQITLVTFVSLINANNMCPQTSSYWLAENSDF
jgi:hypothetical protein